MSHLDLAMSSGAPTPDWDALLAELLAVPTGQAYADAYEKAAEKVLTAVFYPALTSPTVQHAIHGGRKRIDITYTNIAAEGFFHWLGQHFAAAQVFVECKNYGREIGNPELDQLAGRFSPSRGQFGLLVCRTFQDKDLFVRRCMDTANDQRGFVVPLDDGDLAAMAQDAKSPDPAKKVSFELIRQQFLRLIN